MFTVGQSVWVENFRGGMRWVKGVVEGCGGPVTYIVRVQGGALWKRHVDHLRERMDAKDRSPSLQTGEPMEQFLLPPDSLASPAPNNHDQPLDAPHDVDDSLEAQSSPLDASRNVDVRSEPSSPPQTSSTQGWVTTRHDSVVLRTVCMEHCRIVKQRTFRTLCFSEGECDVCCLIV